MPDTQFSKTLAILTKMVDRMNEIDRFTRKLGDHLNERNHVQDKANTAAETLLTRLVNDMSTIETRLCALEDLAMMKADTNA